MVSQGCLGPFLVIVRGGMRCQETSVLVCRDTMDHIGLVQWLSDTLGTNMSCRASSLLVVEMFDRLPSRRGQRRYAPD